MKSFSSLGCVIFISGCLNVSNNNVKHDSILPQMKYIPEKIALLAFKKEMDLQLYYQYRGKWHYIKQYSIRAASGVLGPKLHEGDRQVPEGIYHIVRLNPLSHYTLSMKIDYPNQFDNKIAQKEHRYHLGGDIFIHGKAVSAGCLALGDRTIKELFPLVEQVGMKNTLVIIAPNDFRIHCLKQSQSHLGWVTQLYHSIQRALDVFPLPFYRAYHLC